MRSAAAAKQTLPRRTALLPNRTHGSNLTKGTQRRSGAVAEAVAFLQEFGSDLALIGFPQSWLEPQLRVLFVPLGGCSSVKLKQAAGGSPIALVQLCEGVDINSVVDRLQSTLLASKGLHIECAGGIGKGILSSEMDDKSYLLSHAHVQIQGLKSQVELNGSLGQIKSFDEDAGRWLVHLDDIGDDNEILVPSDNLVLLEVEPPTDYAAKPANDVRNRPRESNAVEVQVDEFREAAIRLESAGAAKEDDRPHKGVPGYNRETVKLMLERTVQKDNKEAAALPTLGVAPPPAKVGSQQATKGPLRIVAVSGFHEMWSQEELEEFFVRYGELRSVRLARRGKGGPRSALVVFRKPENAKSAVTQVNGTKVNGSVLRCELRTDVKVTLWQGATGRLPLSHQIPADMRQPANQTRDIAIEKPVEKTDDGAGSRGERAGDAKIKAEIGCEVSSETPSVDVQGWYADIAASVGVTSSAGKTPEATPLRRTLQPQSAAKLHAASALFPAPEKETPPQLCSEGLQAPPGTWDIQQSGVKQELQQEDPYHFRADAGARRAAMPGGSLTDLQAEQGNLLARHQNLMKTLGERKLKGSGQRRDSGEEVAHEGTARKRRR